MYRGDPNVNQCVAYTKQGTGRCKRTAMQGYCCCDTHGTGHKYYIRIQRKVLGKIEHAVWPLLFKSRAEAETFMTNVFRFDLSRGIKQSASVERTKAKFITCDPWDNSRSKRYDRPQPA